MLCVGTELEKTPTRGRTGEKSSSSQKGVFSGKIVVYAANSRSLKKISFGCTGLHWDSKRIFPLAKSHNPNLKEI